MTNKTKGHDFFKSFTDFEELLDLAKKNASNQWAEDFCKSIETNYRLFSLGLYLSEAQVKKLREIAEGQQVSDAFDKLMERETRRWGKPWED